MFRLKYPKGVVQALPDGSVEISLNQEEARETLYFLTRHISHSLSKPMMRGVSAPRVEGIMQSVKPRVLPPRYKEIGRVTDSPFNKKRTYVYGKGRKGYICVVLNGKPMRTFTLGKIEDSQSKIGMVLRAIPSDRLVIKNDLAQTLPRTFLDGRLIKAVLDILKIEGYVTYERVILRKGVPLGYIRTRKMEGLEGESNHEPEVQIVSPNPTR